MPLYFAYGANMDVAAMAACCPRSRPLGLARLARHRFIVMATGHASVVRAAKADVHGLLWDLALADVSPLDRYEEVTRGLYKKAVLPVLRAGAGSVRALVYVGSVAQEGAAKPGYLENVISAARALGLPAPYISYLETLPSLRKPDASV